MDLYDMLAITDTIRRQSLADRSPGENLLLPGGDETRAERLPDKCTVRL